MKIHHSPGHWIAVALVLALALLTLSNVYGQRSDGAATYRGRPSMAGAQSGTGAQSGLPQGGLGQQGTEGSERTIATWPAQAEKTPLAEVEPPPNFAGPRDEPRKPEDARKDKGVAPKKDPGMAKDEASAAKKAKKATKETVDRGKHGVSPIGSTAPAAPAPSN